MGKRGRPRKHPWPDMKVDDEYVVCEFDEDKRTAIFSTAKGWAERNFPDKAQRPVFSAIRMLVSGFVGEQLVVKRIR